MTPDIQRVQAALAYIPAHDRETWLRVGMGLKSELGDDGYGLWSEWSRQDESFNERDANNVWKSIRPNGRVTIGTVFHEAQQRGYKSDQAYKRPSRVELEQQHRERDARIKASLQNEQQLRGNAQRQAAELWKQCQPAESHAYLTAKGINPYGARLYRGPLVVAGMRCDGCLVIPIRDAEGLIHSLEFINAQGEKRFLPNGAKQGHYFAIGKPSQKIIICEGYATGGSLYEATGDAVAIAFDAGNLLPVAKALRAKYPDTAFLIAADNDQWTEGNPGTTKAKEAAQAVKAGLVCPQFKDVEGKPTDFNDLHHREGLEAVKRQIEKSGEIEQSTPAVTSKGDDTLLSALSVHEDSTFPEPLPLPEGLPIVAPFDFALLPDTLKPWAQDICERVQCPADYVGVTILAALGSVIGRKVGIRPQAYTDWLEVPNQWAMVVGRPGVLKSPAMEAALSPLKRLCFKATQAHEAAIAGYEQAARMAKLRAEAGEKAARAKLAKNPGADVSGDLRSDDVEEPSLKRYIANDTTAEALGELLRQNNNGLLVFRDELVSLLKGLDREENAAARGFYLTGWNGTSAYTFDRIGRGMNLHIPAVCISLLGSTQPGRIAEYLRTAVKGGSGDDGLIQRFGLLVWPDTGGTWKDVDRWPDSTAKKEANRVFEMLDELDPQAIGAGTDEYAEIPFLRFDTEGLELFREWREGWEPKLRGGELHPALESHLAKYRKLVPAIALTLHLAAGEKGPVTKRPTLQALAWAEYLESHARRAYASVSSPEVAAAKAIIEKLKKGELSRTFAARDIYRRGWAQLSDRQHVLDALQLLADLDRLVIHSRDTEGRTATVYEANPRGLAS